MSTHMKSITILVPLFLSVVFQGHAQTRTLLSCGADYCNDNAPTNSRRAILAQLNPDVVRIQSDGLNWRSIESVRGTYKWSYLDVVVKQALTTGKVIVYTVSTWPTWSTNQPYSVKLQGMAKFAAALHKRYPSVILDVFNEPMEPNGLGDGSNYVPAPLASSIAAGFRAVRAAVPDAYLIGPSFVGFDLDTIRALKDMGALDLVDGISWHTGCRDCNGQPARCNSVWPNCSRPTLAGYLEQYRAIFSPNQPKELWVLECYPRDDEDARTIPQTYRACGFVHALDCGYASYADPKGQPRSPWYLYGLNVDNAGNLSFKPWVNAFLEGIRR